MQLIEGCFNWYSSTTSLHRLRACIFWTVLHPKFNITPEEKWLDDDPFILGPVNFFRVKLFQVPGGFYHL